MKRFRKAIAAVALAGLVTVPASTAQAATTASVPMVHLYAGQTSVKSTINTDRTGWFQLVSYSPDGVRKVRAQVTITTVPARWVLSANCLAYAPVSSPRHVWQVEWVGVGAVSSAVLNCA